MSQILNHQALAHVIDYLPCILRMRSSAALARRSLSSLILISGVIPLISSSLFSDAVFSIAPNARPPTFLVSCSEAALAASSFLSRSNSVLRLFASSSSAIFRSLSARLSTSSLDTAAGTLAASQFHLDSPVRDVQHGMHHG